MWKKSCGNKQSPIDGWNLIKRSNLLAKLLSPTQQGNSGDNVSFFVTLCSDYRFLYTQQLQPRARTAESIQKSQWKQSTATKPKCKKRAWCGNGETTDQRVETWNQTKNMKLSNNKKRNSDKTKMECVQTVTRKQKNSNEGENGPSRNTCHCHRRKKKTK